MVCLGGMNDVDRCKKLTRELEGLPPHSAGAHVAKATPFDIQTFQQDTSTKFPTYVPPPHSADEIPEEKIASAVLPIPRRRPFVPGGGNPSGKGDTSPDGGMGNGSDTNATNGNPVGAGTPAPTPPPSPPPKNKQKFQTDQRRPFVFPFTTSVQAGRRVPYSVDEAADLYKRHMHIATELWQTWRTREEAIQEERGVGEEQAFIHSYQVASGPHASQVHQRLAEHGAYMASRTLPHSAAERGEETFRPPGPTSFRPPLSSSGNHLPQPGYVCGVRLQGRGEPTMALLSQLDHELVQEAEKIEKDHALAVTDSDRYVEQLHALARVRADVRRLTRVEQLYWSILPQLPSAVIVLLKLLLATVTAQSQSQTNSAHERAVQSGVSMENAPPPTLEDIDVARHREVTAKAIAAILLYLLKWFKASHAIKFHYLSLLLTDSNCLLLILKMFGMQEVAHSVCTINEAPLFNFFQYCSTFCGPHARMLQPEDSQVRQPFRPGGYFYQIPTGNGRHMYQPASPPDSERDPGMGMQADMERGEPEYVDPEYSFRNLFSTIAFTRILQKLTKRRVHRILLLVQYKSSAILKRSLRVTNGAVQRYVLKILRSQVPFCGRKWRQSNMKVITAIYLALTPNLRNEWLAGADVDTDISNSVPQDQSLRALIQFYNTYKPPNGQDNRDRGRNLMGNDLEPNLPGQAHGDASGSASQGASGTNGIGDIGNGANAPTGATANAGTNGEGTDTGQGTERAGSSDRSAAESFFGSDLLPPVRRNAENTAGSLRYIPDDVVEGYLDNYEDVLGEVFGATPGLQPHEDGDDAAAIAAQWNGRAAEWGLTPQGAETAWSRLGEILGEIPVFSDTDSVGSGPSAPPSPATSPASPGAAIPPEPPATASGPGSPAGVTVDSAAGGNVEHPSAPLKDENRNEWEHLSPKEMRYLSNASATSPVSPSIGRRRVSRGGAPGASPGASPRSGAVVVMGGNAAPGSAPNQSPRLSLRSSPHTLGVGVGIGLSSPPSAHALSPASPLRPVLPFSLEELDREEALDLGDADAPRPDDENLPAQVDEVEPFNVPPLPHPKDGGIDEVEHIFGA